MSSSSSFLIPEVNDCVQFVEGAAANYVANEDQLVELRVNGHSFRVSKIRLTHRSPVFREMFNLAEIPACSVISTQKCGGSLVSKIEYMDGTEKTSVELHNDPEEFKHFLWYLHADPLSAHQFHLAMPTAQKCHILLGIASVAHMYEALDVAEWAMGLALQLFMVAPNYRPFSLDPELAERLLCIAARFQEASNSKFLSDARDIVCDALHPGSPGPLSADPITAMLLLDDTFILGHAYFYTLLKGKDYWLEDRRLAAAHRQRLVCGGFALGWKSGPQSNPGMGRAFSASYSRPLPNPPPMPTVWYPGIGGGPDPTAPPPPLPPVWEPLVHHDIRDRRNELWALFDNEPWRLTD